MRFGTYVALAASLFVESSFGWSLSSTTASTPSKSHSSTTTTESSLTTRREALNGAFITLLGTALVASPDNAWADVTNKVASTQALRNVKRAQAQLPKLKPTVEESDFVAVKAFLRNPPFDEVRKNAFILVRGGEDSPKANELQARYKSFIASVEKIDSSASLGMRGRKVSSLQLAEEYDNVLKAMESFVKLAEETADIPVQYSE